VPVTLPVDCATAMGLSKALHASAATKSAILRLTSRVILYFTWSSNIGLRSAVLRATGKEHKFT
jgi:hypothetical protein